MNIPLKVYKYLSTPERIRAAVLASAREDEKELQVLKETCPKRAVLMTDPEYSEGMKNLFSLLLFVEYQLACCALDIQLAQRRERQKECDAEESALQAAASIVAALHQLIVEMGLDPQAMAQIAPPRHSLVTATIIVSEGEEDSEMVDVLLQNMRERLAT